MKRIALCLALATAGSMGAGVSASVASAPVGGCAPAFTLRPVSDFGPGFQDFLVNRVDKNGDRMVCAQVLPEALPFPNINFVDNVVRA